jgi:hypothetical protein
MHSPRPCHLGTSQSILFPKRVRGNFLRNSDPLVLSLYDVLIYHFCRRKCKLKPSTQGASLINCHCSTISLFSHTTLHPVVIVRPPSFLRPRITNLYVNPQRLKLPPFLFLLLQKTSTNPHSTAPKIIPFASSTFLRTHISFPMLGNLVRNMV